MPDTNLAHDIKVMMEEIKGQFEAKTEDGQVIKLLDVFKLVPGLQEKYASVEKRLEEAEKQLKSRPFVSGLPGLELEKDKFSLCRALNCIRQNKDLDKWSEAPHEAEVFRQMRAMSSGDDSTGGYLVPPQAMPEFIEMYRAEAVCVKMGPGSSPASRGLPSRL
jgi:HK97 family phage major capsid protein